MFNQNIFKDIILSIKDKFEIAGEDNFTDFIRSYKDDLRYLHPRINKSNVRIDYSNERLQLVYVLRYMHAYWYQIFDGLQIIKSHHEDDLRSRFTNNFRCGFYAAGPAPEIIGFQRFFSDKSFLDSQDRSKIKNNNIEIHFLDRVKEWNFARETFLFSRGRRDMLLNDGIKIVEKETDLLNIDEASEIEGYYDLISLQNFSNEIFTKNQDEAKLKQFFDSILFSLDSGGYLVFSDRDTDTTRHCMNFCLNEVQGDGCEVIYSSDDPHKYKAYEDSYPPKSLLFGNFYVTPKFQGRGLRAMNENNFYLMVLKKDPRSISWEELAEKDFFRIEDINIDFIPSNKASPFNDLIGSYEKIAVLRKMRVDNANNEKPLNSGLPNSNEEIVALKSKKNSGLSLSDLADYFQRSENVIKQMLNE